MKSAHFLGLITNIRSLLEALMIIRMKSGNTNCYLLLQEKTRKAVLIDAGVSSDHTFLERLHNERLFIQNCPRNLNAWTLRPCRPCIRMTKISAICPVAVTIELHSIRVPQGIMDFPPAKGIISNAFRKASLNGREKSSYQKFVRDIVLDNAHSLSYSP